MSDYITIYKYDRGKKTWTKPVKVKTEYAKTHMRIDMMADGAELVFGDAAYDFIMKKIEMAERLCPGTALWRDKDAKTVQE